jgi:hypothetical protein
MDDNNVAIIDNIRKNQKKLYGEGQTNAFLFNMDIGVLFHYAEMYDSSNAYLMRAEEIFDGLFAKSVTNEAAALLTNDNVKPYRSKPYELVLLHQFVALNFMAEGKFDEALVEARKMQIYFNEWERAGAEDKKYHTDGMFHLFSSLNYEGIGERDNSLISLFKSVEAYKLGPVKLAPEVEGFAYDRLTAGERESDVGALGLSPAGGQNKWSAKQGEPEIVIVGYIGRGPKMVEQNWSGTMVHGGDLYISAPSRNKKGEKVTYRMLSPLLPETAGARGKTKAGSTFHVSISLPELIATPSTTRLFDARLEGSDEKFQSVVVNDIDLQAKKALEDDWGAIVGRTAVRTVIRTITADQAKKRLVTSNPLVNLAASIVTDIAADQLEKADVRMCFMLPQKVTVTRIPVEPGAHTVKLEVRDNAGAVIGRKTFDNVAVKRGEKKVLIHKSFM